MNEALRHYTGPCGGRSVRRVSVVRLIPSRGGTGREDPEGWGRATKEIENGRWPQPFGKVRYIC